MNRNDDKRPLPPSFARVRFELDGDSRLCKLVDPDAVSWRRADNDEELACLLYRSIEDSIDPREAASVRAFGAHAVAVAMVQDAREGHGYQCERDWWAIVDFEDEPSGLVLPVTFTGGARDGLDEGTIYHIAVVPEHRGRGLGKLLLGRGTDVLLNHGVWQITTDTAVENEAMIRLFELQGWRRLALIEVGDHPLPGLAQLP